MKWLFNLSLCLALSSCATESSPTDAGMDSGTTPFQHENIGKDCSDSSECLPSEFCFKQGSSGMCTFKCSPERGACDVFGFCAPVGNEDLCMPRCNHTECPSGRYAHYLNGLCYCSRWI